MRLLGAGIKKDGDEGDRAAGDETLASRIDSLLRRLYVGREGELEAFERALEDTNGPSVIVVTGELGVGKSALLGRFAAATKERGRRYLPVDARSPSVRSVLDAAATLLRSLPVGSRAVLAVDHFHALHALDDERWFLQTFLPSLPTDTLVVLADRRDAARLSLEPNGLVPPFCRTIPLRPLLDTEAATYLRRRGVGDVSTAAVDAIVEFARGMPVLLAAAAELVLQNADISLELLEGRALAHIGYELGLTAESEVHRAALATLVLARTTVFELLAATLPSGANVESAYRWLASSSFVDQTPGGLRPHSVARKACAALLAQNHPSLVWSVRDRARAFYDQKLREAPGSRARWAEGRLFLERETPAIRTAIEVDEPSYDVGPARPDDVEAIVKLAVRHGGEGEGAIVRRWFQASVGTFDVLRRFDGTVAGYLLSTAMHELPPEAIADDPALGVVRAHLARNGVAPSSSVLLFRSAIIDGHGGTTVSSVLASLMANRVLGHPTLTFHAIVTATPRAWLDVTSAISLPHVVAGSYGDAHAHAVLVSDWRGRQHVLAPPPDRRPEARASAAPAPTSPNEFGTLLRARLGELAAAAGLTSREKEVLDLVVLGRNAVEIGKVLGISARTAKFHQARLLAKLGADSRIDLFRLLL